MGEEVGRPATAPPGPLWYGDLLKSWARSLRRRGRSPGTQRTYRWALHDFGRWLSHCHVERAEDLVAEVIYSWQDTLLDRDLGPSSRMVAATALRTLLRWAASEQLGVPAGLWERVDAVRVPDRDPRPLEPEHLQAILADFARRRRGLEQLRDRALFLFLLTTGSRIRAALSLNRDQLAGPLVVRQKGGGEHRLLPSAQARVWIDEYLRARGRDDEPALWIRVGARGRHRLDPQRTNELWAQLADRLRIPRFTSHTLKHTAVTELGELTESDQEIAEHVGWKGTQMIRRYRKLRDARRQQLVDRLDDLVPDPPAPDQPRRRPRVDVLRGRTLSTRRRTRRGPDRGPQPPSANGR